MNYSKLVQNIKKESKTIAVLQHPTEPTTKTRQQNKQKPKITKKEKERDIEKIYNMLEIELSPVDNKTSKNILEEE